MITYTTSKSDSDLLGIIALQKKNLAIGLSQEEIDSQGFVTVVHAFEDLKKMNDMEYSIVAKVEDQVIAYLLAMTVRSRFEFPVLYPMFEVFEKIAYRGRFVAEANYLVVGQVCVDKAYRGQGILDACYAAYKAYFKDKYDFAITEIAKTNPRSIRAHERIGFERIHEYVAPDGVAWSIVAWDWS